MINSAVTKNYNNGYVQVEIGAPNRAPKYYKVPELKADEFQKEYKNNRKKIKWATAGIMLGAVVAVLLPVSYFTKKIENKTMGKILGIASGVVGGIGAMFLNNKIEINSHEKLLKKYNAEVIDKKRFGLKLD